MSLAHVHLLLNHFPVIGTIMGLGLFVFGLAGKNEHVAHVSFLVFWFISMLAFPTYLSGDAAAEQLRHLPGVSANLIVAHRNAALLAFIFVEITGGFSWLALWQYRRLSRVPRWNLMLILLLSVVTVLMMSTTGGTGGSIRHPEIANDALVGPAWTLDSVATGTFVTKHTWMWPTCETLHFVGLSLLFGVVFLIDLRILGFMKSVSYVALHRLLPWGILGFGLNLLTGMLFFLGIPAQYTNNVAFYWKILCILLAGASALYFTVSDQPWALKSGDEAPFTAKALAVSVIVFFIGVMYFGSMLPFLGNSY